MPSTQLLALGRLLLLLATATGLIFVVVLRAQRLDLSLVTLDHPLVLAGALVEVMALAPLRGQ